MRVKRNKVDVSNSRVFKIAAGQWVVGTANPNGEYAIWGDHNGNAFTSRLVADTLASGIMRPYKFAPRCK